MSLQPFKIPPADPLRKLRELLSHKLNGNEPSDTQLINLGERYITMGLHFEILMNAINAHDTLQYKWEDLLLLLKLTEGHTSDN